MPPTRSIDHPQGSPGHQGGGSPIDVASGGGALTALLYGGGEDSGPGGRCVVGGSNPAGLYLTG